ncbi:MAG: zinc ribbon domain-containing protein [Bacillota bacterium]|nr:zinc ribbon domain-containing protein [Bacillota bacterium]
MNKCPKCGSYIPDGGKMCIACGWKPEHEEMLKDNPFFDYFRSVMDSVSDKNDGGDGVAEALQLDNKNWIAAASYLGPAFLYTYFVKSKGDELINYHANQACLLFIFDVATNAFKVIPVIGKPIKKLCGLAAFVFAFLNAKKAVAHKMEPVPFIGELGIELLK